MTYITIAQIAAWIAALILSALTLDAMYSPTNQTSKKMLLWTGLTVGAILLLEWSQ